MHMFLIVFLSLISADYSGFGASSLTAEQLAKYAPPPPRADLKGVIEKLVDIRVPQEGFLSRHAKSLYTNWNVTGVAQTWKLLQPMGFPQQLTAGEDKGQVVSVSPDDKWLIIERDSKSDENSGLFLISSDGGELETIYYNSKHQASFIHFSEDSKFIYYRVNDIEPSSYAIYKYNIQNKSRETVWNEPGIWHISDIKKDHLAILVKEIGSLQNEHYLLDLQTKKISPIIGQGEKENFHVYFMEMSDGFVVVTNKISDFNQIYELKKGKLELININSSGDVYESRISSDHKKLAFVVSKDGYRQVHVLDLKTKKVFGPLKEQIVDQMSLGFFSADGESFTYSQQSATKPSEIFSYNLKTKKSTRWVVASTPEMNSKNFIRAELQYYKSQDGTSIPMFVWRPQSCLNKNCPVVVNFHGGPEGQSIPQFNAIISLYNQKGFVYVTPNVRGSEGYGKSWINSDNGPKRLNVITDIRDCADFIKKNWKSNGESPKVGITGGSYGGYSTLVGMTMFAGSYDAGLAMVGMSNLLTFLENTAPYRRILRVNEYGDPETNREELKKLSPITYIDQVKGPIMIIHGATDPRVPVGEAIQFYENVKNKNKNKNSSLIIFPDEGHGTKRRANIVSYHSYAIDFFEKHLR